jgi:23S rRNA G2445 N2-methylase RlmL
MTIRTMIGFSFELPPESYVDGSAGAGLSVDVACVRSLTSERARQILETWTRGVVRYRLDWSGQGHKRGATWRLVHALQGRMPDWVNDPSESTWEASIRVDRSSVRVRLTPRRLSDPRFAYRVRDVPAASHPTLAAALVRASRPRPDDVVWDPFVGSGSELVERAIAGPYTTLLGTDVDARALEAAGENLKAAGVGRVSLELADALHHAPQGVACIVTNPPMGRRVARDGSLAEMLDAFLDQVARVLVPGGRLVWLSPLGARTARRAEGNYLRVTLRQPVDMGGFHAELQIVEK